MRTVIEDKQFQKDLRKIQPNFERADEFVAGVKWVLARDPEAGKMSKAPNVWFISVNPHAQCPPAVIYYAFDDQRVYLISIVVVERNGDY